ncbi:LuxR C-terminal-related transcriptional regulator [Pseudomonas sp. ZM23]|uniref:LuxR C-terminal-related transcriptional regulator n=1 Tax=Pseudomonas triclosanedens TaxID=2961893 RepID=A0ABY7A5P0_9PSED|nr:LuxR C-terminal-related transcriptional regulator [Pseudomonas triclosanedens]MCP8466362.1 LuxR C-terminal-related transcriptional regulator [Pseudomonas triclosanedens]MCP8471888.1 LuxR C-terminal-related transcriptional regulator [Pseudomonas triclosanedens]MCP8478583.1 LuxR C-terminal-related transcriptional regulator [Pseudomonas triclosanedens]WAI52222.1 LuxR C-terminal-related transcriptional regulator [Pseudomonas triclosanedens]
MARILIVETLPAIRRCLETMLEQMGHTVAGSVASGSDGLELVRMAQPDLVILELCAGGRSGFDLIRRMGAHSPDSAILVYTALKAEHFAPLCFNEGVRGFVSKLDDLDELALAIRSVLKGRSHYPAVPMATSDGGGLSALSTRELSVLQLIAEGKSNQAIADTLSISFKTVSTHKTHLQEKLHVDSRMELVELARRHGLGGKDVAEGFMADTLPAGWESEIARLRAMLDAVGHPMFLRGHDARLLLCNQAFLNFYGVGADEVAGMSLLDSWWFDAADRQRMEANFSRLLAEDAPFSLEITIKVRGAPRLLHVWGMPFRDDHGQAIGIVGGLRDMTEQAQRMTELRDARRQAEAANEARLDMFGVILAELDEALAKSAAKAAEGGSLEELEQSIQRLKRLTDLAKEERLPTAEPSDIAALTAAQLQSHGVEMLPGAPATIVAWLAVDAYRELLDMLCLSCGPMPRAELAERRNSRGLLELQLNLSSQPPASAPSAILLRTAELLAEKLGGRLLKLSDSHGQKLVLALELEETSTLSPV